MGSQNSILNIIIGLIKNSLWRKMNQTNLANIGKDFNW